MLSFKFVLKLKLENESLCCTHVTGIYVLYVTFIYAREKQSKKKIKIWVQTWKEMYQIFPSLFFCE
jgi:hypothetical protein